MTWLFLSILASAGIVGQTTVAPQLAIFGVGPDWMFCLVVFGSLHLPQREACAFAWVLGLLMDMMSLERLGLMGLLYLLSAVAITATRHLVFVRRPLAHFFVTLLLYFLVFGATIVYRRIAHEWLPTGGGLWLRSSLAHALYTAIWAPVVVHGALRLFGLFGLDRHARAHARAGDIAGSHV